MLQPLAAWELIWSPYRVDAAFARHRHDTGAPHNGAPAWLQYSLGNKITPFWSQSVISGSEKSVKAIA